MNWRGRYAVAGLVGVVVIAAAAAGLVASGRLSIGPGISVADRYPEPRFPSYLKAPQNIDDVMPFARAAVRQTGGRTPLGLVEAGKTALLVVPSQAEDLVVEAIRRAYQERGVTAQIVGTWELKGLTREQDIALNQATHWWTAEHGYMESHMWITGRFPDAERAKAWLKETRPDLYDVVFPQLQVPDIRAGNQTRGLVEYLDQHPEVDVVFYGFGGRTSTRRQLLHHGDKFYGNFTYQNRWEVMSKVPSYPGDLWRLGEEKTTEPIAHIDRVEVRDPQGTSFAFDLDEQMAQQWSKGVYQQGHLYMYPAQAAGRIPYSLVEYPQLEGEFLRPVQPKVNGVFAGTTNHTGFFPRIEVSVKDGYIGEIRGGGLYGELWRTFLRYPGINEAQYPYHDRPGYWYLYEAGTGTNPKYFGGPHSSERNVGGVIHWGFGLRVEHSPEGPQRPREWDEFTRVNNLPNDHWWHIHNVLPTYRGRIRGTEQWVTLIDRGRMTALDSPELRALASRYGDPDDIVRQEWVRHLPGINAPGSYEEYSRNPWPFEKQIDEEIEKGTYRYFSR